MQIGIVGSGAIGTDFLAEMARGPDLELAGIAGIDPILPDVRRLGGSACGRQVTGSPSCLDVGR